MNLSVRVAGITACVALVAGCAAGPKKVYDGPDRAPAEVAVVHPTTVPGGLMLIRHVDDLSTYSISIGFLGSACVLPGDHRFEVEVSHGFSVQDAGGPAWTAPNGVPTARVEGRLGDTILVTKGVATLPGHVEANKVYEMKFGFDRSDAAKPVPVVWLMEIPGSVTASAK
jgi:hypothetical protein